MAHPALTGVLLVGGASSRFGSPKALAQLRGQTLAERAWRVLGEACDEVLAVGKAADGLRLPFQVVDDAAASRAPVNGVIAGLRAATHETCIVLPVDCPLVTPGALRSLGECAAVAPEGPLPGAYTRAMLPELERRLAQGELSLRGVNPTTSGLPAELFDDVDTPEELEALRNRGTRSSLGAPGCSPASRPPSPRAVTR